MPVTVSPKYQVVIPKEIREKLKLRPGQKVEFVYLGGAVQLVPERPMQDVFGLLKGVKNDFDRDAEWADETRDRLLRVD